MMRVVPVLWLLVALAGVPTAAQQQENKLEPSKLESYRRWGFLRARPGFELTKLGYDSNILSNSTNERISDYTATLSPKLDGLILLGRSFVTLSEKFHYTLYRKNHEQNFWNNQFSARATVPLRSFGVFSEIAVDDLRWRPIDQEDVRIESRRRNVGTGVILQPGWRTEIELARHVNRWRYTDVETSRIGERLDRDEFSTDLDVSYRLRGRSQGLLHVQNKEIDFRFPFDTGTARLDQDTTEWRTLAGLKLGPGSSIVGQLLVGWSSIDARDPALADLSDWIAELDATWVAASRTRIHLTAERSPGFAVSAGNAYYLNTQGGIRTVHYFTNVFGGVVAYYLGELDFPEAQVGVTRRDKTQNVEVGVRLRLFAGTDGRRIEYSATVGRNRRDSNLNGFDQERTTFSFGAVLGF